MFARPPGSIGQRRSLENKINKAQTIRLLMLLLLLRIISLEMNHQLEPFHSFSYGLDCRLLVSLFLSILNWCYSAVAGETTSWPARKSRQRQKSVEGAGV